MPNQVDNAVELHTRTLAQPTEDSAKNANLGCDDLSRISQSQLDDQLAGSRLGKRFLVSQTHHKNALGSGDDQVQVRTARTTERMSALTEGNSPVHSVKKQRTGEHSRSVRRSVVMDEYTQKQNLRAPLHLSSNSDTERIFFSSSNTKCSSLGPDTEGWLAWRLAEEAALNSLQPSRFVEVESLGYLSILQEDDTRDIRKEAEIAIGEVLNTLSRMVGQEAIKQVRVLQKEYLPPESRRHQSSVQAIPWTLMFRPPISWNAHELSLCLSQYASKTTALHCFSSYLAEIQLYRVRSSDLQPNLQTLKVAQQDKRTSLENREKEKLHVLASAFGAGILALIPSYPRIS